MLWARMVVGQAFSPLSPVLTAPLSLEARLVEPGGFEPPPRPCEGRVFPLDYGPRRTKLPKLARGPFRLVFYGSRQPPRRQGERVRGSEKMTVKEWEVK